MKLPVRFLQCSRYYIRVFAKMVLLFMLPLAILIICLFAYQSHNTRAQLFQEGRGLLLRAQTQTDKLLLDAQWNNTLLASNSTSRNLAQIQTYSFDIDSKTKIDMLQDNLRSVEGTNKFIDEITVHYRIPFLFVTSSSAWTDTSSNRSIDTTFPGQDFSHAYIYKLIETFEESDNSLQNITHDEDFIYLTTNINVGQTLRGSVIFRCSLRELVSGVAEFIDTQADRLLLMDGQNVIVADSSFSAAGQPLPVLGDGGSFQESHGQIHFQGQDYIVIEQDSNFNGWRYLLLYNMNRIEPVLKANWLAIVLLIVCSILLVLSISLYLTTQFYRPMRLLVDMLSNPELTLSRQYELLSERASELGIVAGMLKTVNLQKLMAEHRLSEQQKQLMEIEHQALRSQINPHFIYNTLESINWKIRAHLGINNEASSMITDLSKLLRLTFRDRNQFIPLRDEIAHAQVYMRLQKARFKEKFSMDWQIDESLLDLPVPPLILQPLLENAIVHGCAGMGDSCVQISFSCARIDGALVLTVRDTGAGLDPVSLEALRDNLRQAAMGGDSPVHIGLANTCRRLSLTYGQNFNISIESQPKKCTTVTITIPSR